MDRSHLEAEQAAREEERLRQECTFKPELSTEQAAQAAAVAAAGGDTASQSRARNWASSTVPRGRSRYKQAAAAVAAAAAAASTGRGDGVTGLGGEGGGVCGAGRRGGARGSRDWELDGCTFSPAVIGARKGMGQAQQYLQVKIFSPHRFANLF